MVATEIPELSFEIGFRSPEELTFNLDLGMNHVPHVLHSQKIDTVMVVRSLFLSL